MPFVDLCSIEITGITGKIFFKIPMTIFEDQISVIKYSKKETFSSWNDFNEM